MAYNSNKETTKITIPLVLGDKEAKLKVGKILDPIVYANSLINTTDGKSYTITEKRQNKQDNQFIGTNFAEQTSKYIILKYNESTKRLEAYPATEWFSFKKNFKVIKTEQNEDDDNKRKKQKSIIDLFKKKGVVEPVKKAKKKKGTNGGGASNIPMSNELEEEEEAPEEKKEEKNEESDGFSSEEDPELKDIPSDIEEGLNMKKEQTELEKAVLSKMKKEEEEEEEDDEDDNDSFAIDEEIEKADSDVDEENVDKELLKLKRGRDDDNYE